MDPLTPHIINIPKIEDSRGNLSVLTDTGVLPFGIARTCWLTGSCNGEACSPAARYSTEEFVVPLCGSIEVTVEGASGFTTFRLDRPDRGVFIPAMTWRRIYCATDATVMIVCSTLYDRTDCIVDHEQFTNLINNR